MYATYYITLYTKRLCPNEVKYYGEGLTCKTELILYYAWPWFQQCYLDPQVWCHKPYTPEWKEETVQSYSTLCPI